MESVRGKSIYSAGKQPIGGFSESVVPVIKRIQRETLRKNSLLAALNSRRYDDFRAENQRAMISVPNVTTYYVETGNTHKFYLSVHALRAKRTRKRVFLAVKMPRRLKTVPLAPLRYGRDKIVAKQPRYRFYIISANLFPVAVIFRRKFIVIIGYVVTPYFLELGNDFVGIRQKSARGRLVHKYTGNSRSEIFADVFRVLFVCARDKLFGCTPVEAIRLQAVMSVRPDRLQIRDVYFFVIARFRLENNFGITGSGADVRKEQFVLHIAIIRFIHIPAIPISADDSETIGNFTARFNSVFVFYGVTEQTSYPT